MLSLTSERFQWGALCDTILMDRTSQSWTIQRHNPSVVITGKVNGTLNKCLQIASSDLTLNYNMLHSLMSVEPTPVDNNHELWTSRSFVREATVVLSRPSLTNTSAQFEFGSCFREGYTDLHTWDHLFSRQRKGEKMLIQRAAKLKSRPPSGLEVQLISDAPLSPALTHSHPSAWAWIQTN